MLTISLKTLWARFPPSTCVEWTTNWSKKCSQRVMGGNPPSLKKGSWSVMKNSHQPAILQNDLQDWNCYNDYVIVKLTLLGEGLINCWCFIFRISLIHYCISHTINQILLRKNLQCFEMIFIVILWKPNVLPGVRVCKTSMTNHLISKEEACCGKAPPEVYPTLSPGKSYPPVVPSVHEYHRQ